MLGETVEQDKTAYEHLGDALARVETGSRPLLQEVAPERVLVRTALQELHQGSVLPAEVWRPLLGGQLQEKWDQLLVNPGDSITIRGATVQKILFGGWVYDTKQGSVPENMRTDIDLEIDNPDIIKRADTVFGSLRPNRVHTKLSLEGNEFDINSTEVTRQEHLRGLAELRAWVSGKDGLPESFLDDLAKLENSLQTASPAELTTLISLFPFETLAFEMKRTDEGVLVLTLQDPLDLFTDTPFYKNGDMSLKNQIQAQLSQESYFGLAFQQLNRGSLLYKYFQALDLYGTPEKFESFEVLWAIGNISNNIKTTCEHNLELLGLPTRSARGESSADFNLLYRVTDKIVRGQCTIDFESPSGEKINGRDFLERSAQQRFARSMLNNPYVAFTHMFNVFPMGGLVSEDVGEVFSPYHEKVKPNSEFWYLLNSGSPSLPVLFKEQLPNEEIIKFVSTSDSVTSYLKYQALFRAIYDRGSVDIAMQTVTGEGENPRTQVYREMKNPPTDMSELMGLMCWAFSWDATKDRDKIHRIVENWKPHGQLGQSWKVRDVVFDIGLDEDRIIETMQKINSGEIYHKYD